MPPTAATTTVNAKLAQLQKMSESVRMGGKGAMRRKKKAPHKSAGADDKKLQTTFKKLGVQPIGDIEEVNLIMENNTVVHFSNPKVQASIPNNIYVVSGANETKKLEDILPSIYSQLGSAAEKALEAAVAAKPDEVPDATFDA